MLTSVILTALSIITITLTVLVGNLKKQVTANERLLKRINERLDKLSRI